MKTRPYSITKTPLNEQDLRTLSEAVEVLRQFKGFSYFDDMGEIVSRLEDHAPPGCRLLRLLISRRMNL